MKNLTKNSAMSFTKNSKHAALLAALALMAGAASCGKAALNGPLTSGSGPEQPATPSQPSPAPCAEGTDEQFDFIQPSTGPLTAIPINPDQVARVIAVRVDGAPVPFTFDSSADTVDITSADAGTAGSDVTLDACSPTPVGPGTGGDCGGSGKPCEKPTPKPTGTPKPSGTPEPKPTATPEPKPTEPCPVPSVSPEPTPSPEPTVKPEPPTKPEPPVKPEPPCSPSPDPGK